METLIIIILKFVLFEFFLLHIPLTDGVLLVNNGACLFPLRAPAMKGGVLNMRRMDWRSKSIADWIDRTC